MKALLFHTIIFLLAVNLAGAGSFNQRKYVVVKVTNSLTLDRPHEIVVLKWNYLQKFMHVFSYDKICVYDTQTFDTLVTQHIDENQNGIPEELIFCSDFKAGETKRFIVKVSYKQPKAPQSLTYAGFVVPREDIAWENDRIAYRIYGPALGWELNNGLDVWTKRVRYLVVEKWYKGDEATGPDKISYHEDHGEGADLFNVGKTLGAGSCALYSKDSLFQPGVFATYKILAPGPLRTMFKVTYKSIKLNGMNISEVKRFTLDARSNLNKIEVTYVSDSLNCAVSFAAGLVKRKGVTNYSNKENRWISLWGLTDEKEENGSLGTGIVMTKEVFNEIKEDSVHFLILGTAELGIPSIYYAGAGWTRSGDFSNADEWNRYLKEFSMRINSPLKIVIEIK